MSSAAVSSVLKVAELWGQWLCREASGWVQVRAAMARDEAEWAERSQAVWLHGGVRPAEVDELLDRMQQFQWGEADPEVLSAAHNSLQSAKDWYSDVQVRLTKSRSLLSYFSFSLCPLVNSMYFPYLTQLRALCVNAETNHFTGTLCSTA